MKKYQRPTKSYLVRAICEHVTKWRKRFEATSSGGTRVTTFPTTFPATFPTLHGFVKGGRSSTCVLYHKKERLLLLGSAWNISRSWSWSNKSTCDRNWPIVPIKLVCLRINPRNKFSLNYIILVMSLRKRTLARSDQDKIECSCSRNLTLPL